MDAGECFLSSPRQDERSSWPLDVILPPCPETTKDTSLLPPSPSHDISTSTAASTPGGSYKALSPQPSTSQPTLLVATSPLHPKYLPKLRTPAESNCQEEDEGEPLLGRVLFSSDGYVYLLKGEGKENQTLPSPASPQDSLNSTVLPCTPPTVFRLISTYQGICSNQISQHTSAGAANPIHLVSGASSKIQDQPKENKVVERGQETNKTLKLTRGSQRTQIVERVLICLPCQLTFRSGNKFGWHASHIHILEHPYQDHLAMRETSGIIHSSSGQIFLSLLEPKINHSSLEAGQEPENIALLGDQSPLLLERIQTVLEPSGKSKDVTSPIPDTVTKSQVAINPEINSVSLSLAPQSSLSFHCCDPAGTPHLTEAKESKAHMNDENGGASWNPAGTKTQGEEDVEEGERPPPNSQSTDITEQLLANQSFYGPMLTSSFSHIGVAPGNDKRGDHTDTERGLQVLDDCTATSGPQSFQSLSLQGQLSLLHSRNSCKTLKCPKCNWHYKYQQTLDVHMKEKHPESQSHCSYCHNGQQHPRLARGESYNCGYKPYRCEACNYSTTTKGNLTIHMQSDKHLANLQSYQGPGTTPNAAVPPLASPVANTGQGEGGQPSPPDRQLKQKASWHCKVCNYETNISRNLRIHMTSEKHMQNVLMLHQGRGSPNLLLSETVSCMDMEYEFCVYRTVFCCPFCAYVSPSEDQVQSHAVSQHALQPTFRCPLCQEQLTGTANLRAHLGHGHNVVSECVEKLLQVAQKVDMSFHTRILPIRVREEPTQPASEVHTSCDIPHQPPTSPPESPPEISTSPVQATEHEGDLDKSQENNSCTACQQLCDSSNDLQEHLEKDHPDLSPSDLQQACEARNRESEVLELDDKTGSQENIPAPPQQVTYRKTTNFAMDKFMDPSRPHKCVVCKESFTQKNILLVHYNSVSHLHKVRKASLDPSLSNRQEQGAASQSHGGQSGQDKPYKCTVCHVSYNQSSTLEIHMRSVLHQTRSRGSKYELAKAPAEKSQRDTICKNEPTNDGKNEPSGELQSAVAQKRRQHIAPCLGVPILPAVAPPAVQLSLDLPRPPPLVQPPPLFASSLLPSFPLIPEALLKLQRQQQQLLLPFYLQELKVGGDGGASHVLPFGGAQQPPSIKEEGDQYSATPRAAKENEDKMPDEQEAATGEADGCQNSESKLEPAPKGAGDPTVSRAHTLLENFGFELVAQYNEGRQPKSSQPQVQPPPPAAPPSVSPTPPSIEKLQCGTCGKLFSNRLILKTHEEHMHQRLLPFEALNQYAARYRRSYDSHNPTGVPMETPSSSVTPLDFSVTSQCSQQTEEKEESGDVSITAEQLNCLHSLLDLSSNPVEEHFLWAANKTDLPPAAIQQWYAQEKTNNEGQEEEGAEASKYDRMGNRRFSRTKFSDFQTQALNSFFEYSAYPRDSEVENLSTLLSLAGRVVVVWFQNARQKARKQAVETGYSSSPPLLPSPPGERPASNSKVPPCKKCGITMPCIFQLIHHLKECYNEQHEEVAGEEEKQEVSRNPSQEEVDQVQEAAPEIPLIFIQVKDEEQKALEEKNIVPSDAKESVRSSTINEEHPQLSEEKNISEEQNLISTTPEMLDQNQLQADNNNVPTNLMDLSLVIPAGPSDTGTQRKRKHEEESLSPTCSEGGDEPPKDKRLRTTILPEQLDILHQWYLQDSNPTRSNLERISLEVRLKKRVVQVWFQNTRARERKGQYRGAPPTVPSGSRQQDDAPNEGTKREATTSFYYSVSPSQVTPSIVTKAVSCPGQGSSPLLPKTQTSLGMTSMAVTSKSLVCPSQALSGILNTNQILPNLINPPQAIPGLVKSTPTLTGLVNPPQGLPSLVNPTQTFPTLVNPAQVLSSLVNSPQSSPGLLLASYTSKPTVASILLHTASEIKQPTTGLLSSSQLSGDQTQKRDKTGSAVVDNPDQNKNVASEQQLHPQTPEDHPLECQGGSNQKSSEKGAAKPLESLIHSPQGGEMSDSSSSDPGPPSPGKGGINSEGLFGSTGARRFRTQMSSLQLRILKACYSEYRTPSMHECDSLGGEIGLQKRVVQVWFQNARAKEKKAKLQGLTATVTSNEGPQPTECTHCNVKYGPTTPCRAHIFSRQHIARLRATIQQQIKEESRYRDNHPTAVAPLVSESKQTSQMLSFQGSNSASPQIQRITPLLMPGQGIPAPIGGLATFNAGPPPGLLGITSTVPPTLLPRATPAAPTSSHSTSETMVDSSQPTATSEQNTGSAVLKGASLMGTPFMPFPLTPAATPLFTPQIQGPYFQQLYGLKKRLFPINPVIPHTLLGLLPGSLKPNPEPSPHQKTDCPQTKATNQCSGEQEAMTGEEESFEHEDDLEDEDIPMVDVAIRYQCQRCKMSFDEEGEAEAHQGSGCYPGSPPHPPPLRQRVCTYHCLSCQVLLQGPAARNQHLRSQQHRVHSMCGDGASSAIPQLRPKSAATSVLMAL
ncbi:hypothetical protein XELAEV_18010232mg [Xenopus laevis]|uniref:Zinc finger homeobox protein 2 n=1 Tax=Xenopus laevis TaxID=8355 RepID=A0A974DUZ8_XENLA|nr:hypothetical protein XELAEV_18010232mg [Xenopus laevis]